jgi:DNA-binding MarR family transcriptional regulator
MRRGEASGAKGRTGAARGKRPGDADQLARHLLALSTAIRDRISAGLVAEGYALGPATTQVLPNLPLEGLGMSELAGRLRLTLQRTGQLVQQLEDAGYVAREVDGKDGRAKRVVYTRRGRALVRDVGAVLARVSGELAGTIGGARFRRFCTDLARLDTAVNGEGAALLLPPRA